MISTELFILVVVIGFAIGLVASLFGIGGGFLILPTLILLLGLETHLAVGTSTFVIVFMSLASSITYIRQKRVDLVITGIVMSASMIGSMLGAYAAEAVSGNAILITFGFVEVILASILGFKKNAQDQGKQKPVIALDSAIEKDAKAITCPAPPKHWFIINRFMKDADGNEFVYSSNILLALPLSFLAGFLSSMLGIGGGTIYIQIFYFVCGMPIHLAIATSMLTIFVSQLWGAGTYMSLGLVDYNVGLALIIGTVIGAPLGAMVNRKINSKMLKPLAAIMIIFIAVRMMYLGLVGK